MNQDIQSEQNQPQATTTTTQAPAAKPKSPDNLEDIIKSISADFKDVTPLHSLATILGLETGQLVLSVIIVAFFLTIIGAGSGVVTLIVGMCYPMFMTLEATRRNDFKEFKQWISYWMIFQLMTLCDGIIQSLFSQFQALYHPLKTMFLVWMYYPRTQGATIIYDLFISKYARLLFDFKQKAI